MTLDEFLLARIAEDEAAARAAAVPAGSWAENNLANDCLDVAENEGGHPVGATHLRRWLPARVLAECAAKREIVERMAEADAKCPADDWPADGDMSWAPLADQARWTLRRLALPYANHADYRSEWAP